MYSAGYVFYFDKAVSKFRLITTRIKIITMSQTRIKCPNCGQDIKVDEIFEHQAEEKFRQEYESKLAEQISALNKKKEEAAAEVLKLKRMKEEEEDTIRKRVEKEKEKIAVDALFKAKKEVEFEMLKIKQENEIKSKENLNLKKKEVEILNKERELKEKAEQLDIDLEKKMIEKEKEIREKATLMEREKNEIRKREFEKKLEEQQRNIENMKQKEEEMIKKEKELLEYNEQIKIEAEKQIRQKLKETEEHARIREKEEIDRVNREFNSKLEEKLSVIEELKKRESELISKENALKEEKEKIKIEAEKQLQLTAKETEEKAVRREQEKNNIILNEFKAQLESQNQLIHQLKEKEIELKRNELELKNKTEQMKLDTERQFLEKSKEIEERAVRREMEKSELRQKEYEKQLEEQKKLINELKKKAELGSQQLQGEIQELALEEFLQFNFPFDVITEVKKGERGADAVQIVRNNLQQDCGKIIYESKRTKSFSESWLEKLKEDQKHHQAEIAVLVTESMPKDMEKFGLRQGIWICSFHEIKSLSVVLREMLIRIHSVKIVQENKDEKMDMLYNYLTGSEFVQQIEAIVEGFTGMLSDLQKEKNAMERIWSTREKQIRKVLISTSSMYGSIRGISGNVIGSIKALELPGDNEEDVNGSVENS